MAKNAFLLAKVGLYSDWGELGQSNQSIIKMLTKFLQKKVDMPLLRKT